MIPGLIDSRSSAGGGKKFYFFGSQEYTMTRGRRRSVAPTCRPARYDGNFSQTRITNGTIQPIIDPGQQFPGNIIPANRINALGQKMLRLLPQANGIPILRSARSGPRTRCHDLTPIHGHESRSARGWVLSDKTRFNVKVIKDRDDDWSWNRITPGTGFVNQNTPGCSPCRPR